MAILGAPTKDINGRKSWPLLKQQNHAVCLHQYSLHYDFMRFPIRFHRALSSHLAHSVSSKSLPSLPFFLGFSFLPPASDSASASWRYKATFKLKISWPCPQIVSVFPCCSSLFGWQNGSFDYLSLLKQLCLNIHIRPQKQIFKPVSSPM